ncbi:MAG: pirin family protein [Proteobacteria bacterium]|nr:pirin family protein [Pseudomonadota bacterium]
MRRRDLLVSGLAGAVLLGCQRGLTKAATPREIVRVVPAQRSRDGAGVKLRRSLGNAALSVLDPFLLLDEIHSSDPADYTAGFPQHPHRGFETVSYVLRGGFDHRDSVGNHGLIADGGAQWMTAGRGIVHQEMPVQTTGSELWGLQLWVNLPAAQKWVPPRYQDLGAAAIPEIAMADARARVVAGRVGATRGPVDGIATRPTLLDVTLEPGAQFHHELPGGDTAFVYVLTGEIAIGTRQVTDGELAATGPGTSLVVTSAQGGRFLTIAATPINEPVARRGPFVMTTEAELDQAFADYRAGRLAI